MSHVKQSEYEVRADQVTEEVSPLPRMITTCRNCGKPREHHYDRGERGSLVCPNALHLYSAGLTRADLEVQLSNLSESFKNGATAYIKEKRRLLELIADLVEALTEKTGGWYRCVACDYSWHQSTPHGQQNHGEGCVVLRAEAESRSAHPEESERVR